MSENGSSVIRLFVLGCGLASLAFGSQAAFPPSSNSAGIFGADYATGALSESNLLPNSPDPSLSERSTDVPALPSAQSADMNGLPVSVPEPMSTMMIGAGLVGLALIGRRRRRRAR